jgi:uncharacterized protein (TIGR03643 family)
MHHHKSKTEIFSDLKSHTTYKQLKGYNPLKNLSAIDEDRIIEMAWEDRTPFEAIFAQFNLKEDEVKALMKNKLKHSSYKMWRKRVEKCHTKHAKLRSDSIKRFKCNLQRTITGNKISKR